MTWYLILALRCTVFALCAYGIAAKAPRLVDFTRGDDSIPRTYDAAWCFACSGILAFQIRWIMAAPQGVNILSLTLVSIGLALFAWANGRTRHKHLDRFKEVYERPDLSLALIDLAHVDRDAAEQLARTARRLTAKGIAASGI